MRRVQVRPGQVRLGQVRLGQVRLGQVRLGQVRRGGVAAVALCLALVLAGCVSATTPQGRLNDAVAEVTDQANSRNPSGLRTAVDQLLAVIAELRGSATLPTAAADRLAATARQVRSDAGLLAKPASPTGSATATVVPTVSATRSPTPVPTTPPPTTPPPTTPPPTTPPPSPTATATVSPLPTATASKNGKPGKRKH